MIQEMKIEITMKNVHCSRQQRHQNICPAEYISSYINSLLQLLLRPYSCCDTAIVALQASVTTMLWKNI